MQSPIAGGLSGVRRTVAASVGGSAFSSSLSRQIAAIEDKNTAAVLEQNQVALQSVNNTLTRIGSQMIALNNSLLTISQLTSQSAALESLKERQKNQQERILAQQQLREGKENVIEKKIQSSLVKPVQRIAGATQGSLLNLMEFFNRLFFGWLLTQGLETISALATGNKEKLEQIKDNVLKNLTTVGLTLFALQNGFKLMTGGLFRVAGFIGKAVLIGLFIRPIKALLDAVYRIAEKYIPEPIMKTLEYAMSLVNRNLPFSPAGAITGGDEITGGNGETVAGGENASTQEEGGFNVNIPGLIAGGATFKQAFTMTPGHPALKFAVATAISMGAENIIANMFPEMNIDLNKVFNTDDSQPAEGIDAQAEVSMKPESKSDKSAAQVNPPKIQDKASTIGEDPKPPVKVSYIEAPAEETKVASGGKDGGMTNRVPTVASANVDNLYSFLAPVIFNVLPA